MLKNNRREFIRRSLFASGSFFVASNIISCKKDDEKNMKMPKDLLEEGFELGVASFDPTERGVIIWTKYTDATTATIHWEVATDIAFEEIIRQGSGQVDSETNFTISVEVQDLDPGQSLYYRFIHLENKQISAIGETITFPEDPQAITMAVCSCSNYQAGLFNVYNAMALSNADVIIHLGDYIYEYGAGGYGSSEDNAFLNRQHLPKKEIISLDDYRTRYEQYRKDKDLQLAHQKKPFICVWDDHEISNDTYKDGAENHQEDEGDFSVRKQNAIQAYSEYLPVRTDNPELIYRTIQIGNLVNLIMLDTRVIGRDKQLDYSNYFLSDGSMDVNAYISDVSNPSRTLLGNEQLQWLLETFKSGAQYKWQVLGQQVLMGKMDIPFELLSNLAKILAETSALGSPQTETLENFQNLLLQLVTIKSRFLQNDPSLTQEEIARVSTKLPYNQDAWDGYPIERETILEAVKSSKNLICLAGDTHNAWHSKLTTIDGVQVGTELATSSISSPGLDSYLNIEPTARTAFEEAMSLLIDDLQKVDSSNRGYLQVQFNPSQVQADWVFVDTILDENYTTSVGFNTQFGS